jgi:hypothetical protein
MEKGRECHPLLRGGRRKSKAKYSHAFSSSHMESIASICETVWPSFDLELLDTKGIKPTNKDM